MPVQNRITVERNIKQDTDTPKYHVTFYHGKDAAGNAIRKTKTFVELAFALGLYTGMRRGELCGLKWDCVSFDKNTIRVKLNRLNVGADIVVKQPKSESSERTINMVPEVKAVLLAEREIQKRNRDLLKSEYHGEGYVICHNNGKEVRPNYLSEMFKQWFDRPSNKDLHAITPHELRHSFVALAIAAGVPLYEISQALGHGDIGITSRIYAQLLDNAHVNATESMAGLLREKNCGFTPSPPLPLHRFLTVYP